MVRTTRAGWVLGPLVAVVAVALLLARGRSPAAAGATPALAAVPPGAALLVTVDVARLRTTALASVLRAPTSELGGCGDPLAEATTLVIATPSEGDDFGVAVAGPFVARALAACATRAIAERGGWATSRGEAGFEVIADATARGAGVVAVRDGGPLLYGGAAYVRKMIAAVVSPAPALDPRHAALRAELDRGAPVVVSLVRGAREEGLRELAVSMAIADRVELRARATCDRAATCDGLAKLAASAKETLGPFAKLTWLGAAASRATVEARGTSLAARVDLSPEEAREAIAALVPPVSAPSAKGEGP